MRFSVLKAGTATRAARARIGDMDRMFIDLLAKPGDQWETHDVEHGDFPPDVGAFDGYVITGGRASATDQDEWMLRLLDTVREIHRREIPLMGFCLGHQVVAKALGGATGVNPKGWDIGLGEVRWTPAAAAHPALSGAPHPLRIYEVHQDVITAPPPGAAVLASSAKCEVEMFTLGATVLGMQGHPEMDRGEVEEIISRRREHLPPEVVERGLASLKDAPHESFLRSFLRNFLHQAAAAPRPLQRSAG